jgi:tetratricopeptide (TPR) repeat protein
MLANVNRRLGRLDEARVQYEEVLGITRAILSPDSIISALMGLGRVCALQGDDDSAITHLVDALTMAQERNVPVRIPHIAEELIYMYLSGGDISRAHEYFGVLVASARALNAPPLHAKAVLIGAVLWHNDGLSEQAASWAGLLADHVQYLDPSRYQQLREALEAELGAARYSQLAEAGRQRDLRTAVEEISAMRDGCKRI